MRDFLKGLELDKETIDSIMAEHGKFITESKEKAVELQNEIIELKKGVSEKDTKISELETKVSDIETVNTKLTELQTKYDTDTTNLKDQLSSKDYEYKVKEKVSGLKFTSESAKKLFINDLLTNKLEMENEDIKGFDDYVKTFKETDPSAFESNQKKPVFAGKTGNEPVKTDGKLSYTELCEMYPAE